MTRAQQRLMIALAALLLGLSLVLSYSQAIPIQQVVDEAGPVAGARVRWQGHERFTLTDALGRFHLARQERERPENADHRSLTLTARPNLLTATKPGYRIASAPPHELPLRLRRLPSVDNENYQWAEPTSCAGCHEDIHREWAGSAHGRSATNPKFLSLFAGPHAEWNISKEYPLGMGVCASCHVPTLESMSLANDVRQAAGPARAGVHCDYCHKVADAPVDKLGTRFGRDGLTLLRPAQSDQLFFGPLDDAVRPGESFAHAPFYKESRYCASCHEGVLFGVHAYATYSEWLASPAARRGVQCQDCHMRPTGKMTNLAPGKGGIERSPATLASHHFSGGSLELLRRCLDLDATARSANERLHVDVIVRTQDVGHRVPTGFIDRHLILVVEALDAEGRALATLGGPVLPASAGDLRGQPGVLYAKQLVDDEGKTPIPYWLTAAELHDTRLEPEKPDRQHFEFPERTARIKVRLIYRRFWHVVAERRRWDDNDTLVHARTIRLPFASRER